MGVSLTAAHSFFDSAGIVDGIAGPGLGFEAGAGDGFARAFADAVRAVADFGEGEVDFAEELAVLFDEAQGEFLFVVIGAHVGHVDGEVGEVGAADGLEGFLFHGADVADEFAAFGEEEVAEEGEVAGLKADLVLDGLFGGDGGGIQGGRVELRGRLLRSVVFAGGGGLRGDLGFGGDASGFGGRSGVGPCGGGGSLACGPGSGSGF